MSGPGFFAGIAAAMADQWGGELTGDACRMILRYRRQRTGAQGHAWIGRPAKARVVLIVWRVCHAGAFGRACSMAAGAKAEGKAGAE